MSPRAPLAPPPPLAIWGLTGGIASGKSTVAARVRAHGLPVVGADETYHALIAPVDGGASPLVGDIAHAFGPEVVATGGVLDRRALGARVFADAEARRRLEAICHPAIARAAHASFAAHAERGHKVGVYDVPLLFERGLEARLAGVTVVWVPPDVQIARLRARDALGDEAIVQRLAAQLPLDSKRARADVVIDNSGSRAATYRQVDAWVASLGGRLVEAPPS